MSVLKIIGLIFGMLFGCVNIDVAIDNIREKSDVTVPLFLGLIFLVPCLVSLTTHLLQIL